MPNSILVALGVPPEFQPARYFKLAKRFSETGSVFFGVYQNCFLDDLIISIGKTVNSFSGSFNTLSNLLVYGLNQLNFDDANNNIVNMYKVSQKASPTEAEVQDFGKRLGSVFTNIFNVKIPAVQYQDF